MATVALGPFQIFQFSFLMGVTRLLQKDISTFSGVERADCDRYQSNVAIVFPCICILGPFVK